MKNCPKCNLEFPDAFRFCGSCGGALASSVRCPGCGELSDGKWAFCTSCGTKLSLEKSDRASVSNNPEAPSVPRVTPPPTLTLPSSDQPAATYKQRAEVTTREWYSAADLYDEDTATAAPAQPPPPPIVPESKPLAAQEVSPHPASHARSAPALTMLSAYGEPEAPSQFRWWHGLILVVFILLVVGGLGIGGWYWWSHRGSVAQTSTPGSSVPGTLTENPAASPASSPTSTMTLPLANTTRSADEEIKQLRHKRIAAKPPQIAEITASFQEAEKKFPTDYRFPYERAKLSIVGVVSHHEAFGALALAAEKAIEHGKAQEMLDNLMVDSEGDFRKLSRGHREWQTLVAALNSKDKNRLTELRH